MNRKEYEQRLEGKKQEIRKIKSEISELKRQYCNSNSPFKIGERIRFKGKEGIITDINVSVLSFDYKWKPFKKDGTEGCERNIFSYDSDKIEKI